MEFLFAKKSLEMNISRRRVLMGNNRSEGSQLGGRALIQKLIKSSLGNEIEIEASS